MICVRRTLLPLASHMESPEEQLGPFFFKRRRDGWDFKELCFRSISTPDQSLPIRASYEPFLGSSLLSIKSRHFYSSCMFYLYFFIRGKQGAACFSTACWKYIENKTCKTRKVSRALTLIKGKIFTNFYCYPASWYVFINPGFKIFYFRIDNRGGIFEMYFFLKQCPHYLLNNAVSSFKREVFCGAE